MNHVTRMVLVILIAGTLSGCYHARIETGLTPSDQIIDIPFAAGWIYGLVPPEIVNTTSECAEGVAIVETEHSFVNSLVGAITFGIYTPIHIKVTCAQGRTLGMQDADRLELNISAAASSDEVIEVFTEAAEEAVEGGKEIYVRFE